MIQSLKCFFHWRRTHKMAFSSFQFLILNNYWNRSSIIGMINNLCFLNFFSGKDRSPVHVVLVSLLVDQLSGLFLTFLGRPKIKLFSLREFLVSLWIFFGQALIFWYTKKKFWYTKKKFGQPKNEEPDQKVPSMWFWSVSWSTNCPVYFSLFLVDQKKICSVSGNFWSGSDFFGEPNFFLVYQNLFLVY